jgi:hypothetical protein
LEVTPLRGGVQIQQIDIRIKVRVWKVIITLEDPPLPIGLIEDGIRQVQVKAAQYEGNVHKAERNVHYTTILGGLLVELADLRREEKAHQPRSSKRNARQRRGLVDAIGWAASGLFGLATEADVQEVRAKVEENRQALQALTAWETEHVAVLNASFEDIRINHADISKIKEEQWIAHAIGQFRAKILEFKNIMYERKQRIDDLEDGRLTERLFPPRLFKQLPIDAGEKWLDSHWYYQAVRVLPSWVANHGGNRHYEVNLPLVRHQQQQGYQIRTFPVLYQGNRTATIVAPPYASLTPISGVVSEPTFCLGRQPLVCDEGPTSDGCAAALVTTGPWDSCRVHIEPQTRDYYTFTGNSVVLLSETTATLTERCPKTLSGIEKTIESGTTLVTWQTGCRLITPRLSIRATRRNEKTVSWSTPGSEVDLAQHLETLKLPPDTTFVLLSARPPPTLDIPDITWQPQYGVTIWLSGLTLAILALIYITWRRPTCSFARSHPPQAPTMAPETNNLEDSPPRLEGGMLPGVGYVLVSPDQANKDN